MSGVLVSVAGPAASAIAGVRVGGTYALLPSIVIADIIGVLLLVLDIFGMRLLRLAERLMRELAERIATESRINTEALSTTTAQPLLVSDSMENPALVSRIETLEVEH